MSVAALDSHWNKIQTADNVKKTAPLISSPLKPLDQSHFARGVDLISKTEKAHALKLQMESRQEASWKELKHYKLLTGTDFSSSKITKLNLAYSRITGLEFVKLLPRFPNIQILNLHNCLDFFYIKLLNIFLQKRKEESLEKLLSLLPPSARQEIQTEQTALINLCSRYPELKELAENGNTQALIAELTSDQDDIRQAAGRLQGVRDKLIEVSANSPDDSLKVLARNYRGLEGLDLTRCRFSEDEFQMLVQNCPRLHTLDLSWCYDITDISLQALAKNCPGLHTFSLFWCFQITDAGLKELVLHCPGIHTLYLNYCDQITDISLQALAQNCPGLCFLILSECKKITDISLQALAQNCPGIHTLYLNDCDQITDIGIQELAKNCSKLCFLILSGCSKITDISLQALAQNCSKLQNLHLNGCRQITTAACQNLFDRCPTLRKITLPNGNTISRPLPIQTPIPSLPVQATAPTPSTRLPNEDRTPRPLPVQAPIPSTYQKIQRTLFNAASAHALSTLALGWIASYAIGWQAAATVSALYLGYKHFSKTATAVASSSSSLPSAPPAY